VYKHLRAKIILFTLLFISLLCFSGNVFSGEALTVKSIKVDNIINPMALTSNSPGFSWQIQSDEKNVLQKAYEVEFHLDVAGTNKIIWTSGKIESEQSQNVKLGYINELKRGIKYQWKARVWDNRGRVSEWSEMGDFRLAPSNIENNAHWIGAIRREDSNIPEGRNYHGLALNSEEGKKWQETHSLSNSSIYLRKEFLSNKKISDAVIYVSGLGHYEITLNGKKLGDSQFDPMWSDYDKTIYYNIFDVTDELQKKNALGILLGNGFYNQQGGRYVKMQVSFGPPTLFFKMIVTYNDGTTEEVVSDNSWKYSLSPLVFNDMYGGEDYDARLEQPGWGKPGFDDSQWSPVVIQETPKGKLTAQTTFPIKIMETYSAVSVKEVGDSYVYDMGQNLSGFPRIKVKGKKGDKIRLILGENIHEDGSVNQSQSGTPYYFDYSLKGGEEEIWQPRYSYYGYRYIQVNETRSAENGSGNADRIVRDIESLFVYNSNPQTSTFETSNDIFNNTHRLIVNAMKSNMHAVFTDCPHREKLGWLEQVHLNGPGLFYNFDLSTFAPKIMQDIRDSQLENGLVPDISPEYVIFEGGFRDSPEWGSASVILPFMYYQFYGDNSLIVEYYDVMKRYVDYLSSTATDHIVSHGLGDWCDYREDQPYGVSHNTPVALSASTHYYMVIDYLVEAAVITGNSEDEKYYSLLRSDVRDAFNREFYNEEDKYYGTGSQASNSMPLFAGIVELENREGVLDNLVKNVKERNYRLSTGDAGNRYLFQTLADNGLNEVMYKMHNHEEVPGYGFQLQFGATTLTELWDPRAGASWNHFMMGQIEEWFFKSLAGIKSEGNSGYKNIIIAPQPVGDLSYVNASYETMYGTISVDWKIDENKITLNVSIPANSTAKIYLPHVKGYKEVGSGSHSYTYEKVSIKKLSSGI
jgi:hypothetical protein